jgi:DMSO reductase anchor subunit
MKCPYDVPKYSARRGIVRKCDMCSGRLAVGEAPACAQACPSEAIRITIVDHSAILASARNGQMLLTAPDSKYTLPATRYLSSRKLPANLRAGDHARVTPASAHLPLVIMLVLSQLSVGASVAAIFTEPARWLQLIAAVSGALAFAIATLHLGRPLKAWRAFLGWRKSWFSREVIVFSSYIPLATVAAWMSWFAGAHAATTPGGWLAPLSLLKIAVAATGAAGIGCSAMIYVDTCREFWSVTQSFGKFFGTALLLGPATTLTVLLCLGMANGAAGIVSAALLFVITFVKLAFEHQIFRHWVDEETPAPTPLNKTARLLAGELGFAARSRIGCGILGGAGLPMLLLSNYGSAHEYLSIAAVVALMFCGGGELLERKLFFTAVAPEKMPGNPAS